MEVMVGVAAEHPRSGGMERGAVERSGCAAGVTEQEKLSEYILPPGKALTPLGVETLIKLSFKENELLKTIKLLWYLLNKPFNIKQHQGEI